jgi:hypothetical protein
MGQMLNTLLQERALEKQREEQMRGVASTIGSSGLKMDQATSQSAQTTARGLLAGGDMSAQQVATGILNDPRYNPQSVSLMDQQSLAISDTATARQQAVEDRAQLMQMNALNQQKEQQAIETNRQALARNGFSAGEIAKQDLEVRGLARADATIQELQAISRADDLNLFKGGGAAKVRYMTDTLEPALMIALQTGVITPGEQPRIDRMKTILAGWKGLSTWGTTQQAQLDEMQRWFSNRASDQIASYGLDPAGYASSNQVRSIEQIKA